MTEAEKSVESSKSPEKPIPGFGQSLRQITENRRLLIAILFLATLFLGLPLLWVSKSFRWYEKIIWTVLNLAFSALIFWLFYLVMAWWWATMTEAFRDL